MSFTQIASSFFRMGLNKFKNGVSLNTLILFDAICQLPSDKLTVEHASKKVKEMYGFEFNSATLSRNNTNLQKLGLIKLYAVPSDRRKMEIKIVAPKGELIKKHFHLQGNRQWKYGK